VGSPLTPAQFPGTPGNHVKIVWPRLSRPLSVLCLSRTWVGLWSHWMDGRSHPCLAPSGCPGCEHESGTKHWAAYLTCWDQTIPGKGVLMLPKIVIADSLVLRDPFTDLRGAKLDCERLGGKANGPVSCKVRFGVAVPPPDAEEPDTLGILCKIWSVMFPRSFKPFKPEEGGEPPCPE